jgi:leader peptidase (prepilin peptidase)/N-methyltransferase
VEALLGILSLALFTRYGLSYQYILFFIFVASLVTIGFIDLDHRIIPDILSLPGIVVGFVACLIIGHISWVDSIIGIVAGGGSLFIIAALYERVTGREGMGGGDIKLLAMIGAWMGWRPLLLVVLIASLIGAVVGSAFILLKGKDFQLRIPFGPFLSFGALLLFFFGPQITRWYFSLFV